MIMLTNFDGRVAYGHALGGLVGLWFAAVLVLNLPGHLTHDSLTQIAEGRSGFVQSWNPVFSSWVFGTLVNWTGGTELIVALSAAQLGLGLYLILNTAPQARWWSLVPVAVLLFGPILLVHPAVVWKDVWFAHFSILAFGLVALRWQGAGWWAEAAALLLMAAALLSRQTGVLVSGVGVLALSLLHRVGTLNPDDSDTADAVDATDTAHTSRASWASDRPATIGLAAHSAAHIATRFAAGFTARLAVLLGMALALSTLAQSQMKQVQAGEVGTGIKLVALFDLAGMLQRQPELHLDRLRAQGFQTADWEAGARATFSAERIDRLEMRPVTGPRELDTTTLLRQWADVVMSHPISYLAHRLEVYAWFGGLRDQALCMPIHVGISSGPQVPNAGVPSTQARMSPSLYQWSRSLWYTPYFSPLFWSGVSALVALLMLLQRQWRHPVFWLQMAGLVYSASYLVVAFSCDFRYSYFSVAAASVGLMWLAASGWLSRHAWPYWMRRV